MRRRNLEDDEDVRESEHPGGPKTDSCDPTNSEAQEVPDLVPLLQRWWIVA